MASKLEEKKAYDKLAKAVGDRPATLDWEVWINHGGEHKCEVMYKAYIAPPSGSSSGYLTDRFLTPIEAVDKVIAMMKEAEDEPNPS